MGRTYKKLTATGILTMAFALGLLAAGVPKALAATYPYDAANLISDSIFSNTSTMNASAIQTFLNNENSGLKRLTDTEKCNPTTPPTSSTHPYTYRFTYYPHCGKKESAATIIYDTGRAYGINPQAILATMQKEQSLVTTPNPTASQINCAMGYNSCSNFKGFFIQVDNGAWALRTDIELMNGRNWWGLQPSAYPCGASSSLYSTGLYPGRTVKFADPGGKAETITLADSATAALYCYTPYVGPISVTGYSGSYNFVQSFEQWFGSTVYTWAGNVTVTTYSDSGRTTPISPAGPFPSGTKIYVTVSAINTGSQTWGSFVHVGTLGDASSPLTDSSWLSSARAARLMQSSVAPTKTGTFEFSITTPNTDGAYSLHFGLVADGKTNGWMRDSATFNFTTTVSNPYNGLITQLNTYSDSGYSQLTDPKEMSYGEKVYVLLKVKNIGTQTWSNTFTKVATESPDNRSSVFSDGSWLSSSRPTAMVESSAAPGQTSTFEFTLTAPNTNTISSESFGLMADGKTSGRMPAPTFTFPISVIDPPVGTLLSGVKLYHGQKLESSNSTYILAMQNDGNLVIYGSGKAIWASHTGGEGGNSVVMQGDGNLVIYTAAGRALWSSRTAGRSKSTLVLQNSGNLVIYGSGGREIWSTDTAHNVVNTPHTLTAGERLVRNTSNNELLSANTNFRLVLQGDGNLVEHNSTGQLVWASHTGGEGGNSVVMQNDGNLVMRTAAGRPVWSSHTAGKGASTLVLQKNGKLVIYDSHGHPTWTVS